MIRAKIQHIEYGEKPSKYLCSLEKSNYITKTITHLQESDGNIIHDQKEILNSVKSFYENLYKSKDEQLSDLNIESYITSDENKTRLFQTKLNLSL